MSHDAEGERAVDAGVPRLPITREPDLVMPIIGGLDAFAPVGDGGYIVEDFTIPRAIRRLAPDMSSVWKVELLELDYPSAMKIRDMLVVGDSVWIALDIDEEIEIDGRRYKPTEGTRDLLVLCLSLKTGAVVAVATRRKYEVYETRFASFDSAVYLASLVSRTRLDVERLNPDAGPRWTTSMLSPDFGRTLEFAVTADAVYLVASARDQVTMGNKSLKLPIVGILSDRFVRAKLDLGGAVQGLELVPVVDALGVAFAANGATQLFLFSGDCRFAIRDASGWSMEHLLHGMRCGGPMVTTVPGGFLLATYMWLDHAHDTWRLMLVSSGGRVIRSADEVPARPLPFDRMEWVGDHVEAWSTALSGEGSGVAFGAQLRPQTEIAHWSVETSSLGVSP